MISGTKQIVALVVLALSALAAAPTAQAASEVSHVVNGKAITTGDIQRRVAFLRIQGQPATRERATQDMIEQTLRFQEMERLRINIEAAQVDAAYANFARQNNMSVSQMNGALAQSGVTADHFREFIRAQMGWGQALQARQAAEGGNRNDGIRELLKEGGPKPSATEYVLNQVVFVIPARERGALMAKRKREAEQFRQQVTGCGNLRELAKGTLDVTVRNVGRRLEQQLPPDWKKDIMATQAGGTTRIRETEMGVEFIAVCETRIASDDLVAELVYEERQQQAAGAGDEDALSKKYTQELRDRAQITTAGN